MNENRCVQTPERTFTVSDKRSLTGFPRTGSGAQSRLQGSMSRAHRTLV